MSESDCTGIIRQLDTSLTNILSSGQLITSVTSVVKELVENSVDAGATNIHISLLSFGLEKVTVRDDGSGIEVSDAPYMARPHCTSKLVDYDDLNRLTTYGFRGEGLASVCTVADVTIETIRRNETVGRAYSLDHEGNIESEWPCAVNAGTVVTVKNLFKNLPVRKQFYSTSIKKEEELRSIKAILRALAIINEKTRLILVHNRTPIWTKQMCSSISKSLEEVLGVKVMQQLVPFQDRTCTKGNDKFKITGFLPKMNCDHRLISKQQPDSTYVFVNRRPVKLKEVFKLLKAFYSAANLLTGSSARYPVCCVMFEVAASSLDVNIDPNKHTVFFHHREELLRELTLILEEHYGLTDDIKLHDLESSIESLDESLVKTPKATVSRIDKSLRSSSSTIYLENEATLFSNNADHSSSDSNFYKDDTESTSLSIVQQNVDEPVCVHVPFHSRKPIETTNDIERPPAKKQKTIDELIRNPNVSNVTVTEAANNKNGMNGTKKLKECATRVLSNCKQRLEEKQLPLDGWVSSQYILRKEKKVVAFNINTLKQSVSNRLTETKQNDGKCRLIGRYNTFWICKMNNELHIINHHRVHEKVLLNSLMQNYKVASRPLGTPLPITENSLGTLEFNTLSSLSYAYTPQDSIVSIADERISSNGFNVRKIEPSSQSCSKLQLVGLADHLPFFGVEDLKEILHKIVADPSVSLYGTRTSVIIQYLKTETVRMVRNCPYRLDKQEIVDLLQSMRKCKSEGECNQCFHGKPFFTKIFDIPINSLII